ncbi:serine proteinase stubble [Trichonephila inaurata madagascariensis]|uniref:Serine proteinase stubble n=1 Tax=Trichonephila inaurata madagascariensis TaxID=2747483 RepID=A0A8X6YB29_9ARAC|nr:serine proteinase stubble [Trichonephila inaurata madagascariensis]
MQLQFVDLQYLSQELPTIRPVPCSNRMTGESGICTFNWSCINVAHGVHIGPCVDRFFVGTCCKIPQGTELNKSDTSNHGVGQGTRKIGQMPTYTPIHNTVASKVQEEKLDEIKGVPLIDIGHFNVTFNPIDYYNIHNLTTIVHSHDSYKANNSTNIKQNSSLDQLNYSSSLTPIKTQIASASFIHKIFFSNYSGFASNKEPLNKTIVSTNTHQWSHEVQISNHLKNSTNTDVSHQKNTTTLDHNTKLPAHLESLHDLGKLTTNHEAHDQRKPLIPNQQHDNRKPMVPQPDHDLRKPVGLEESHDQRWPVLEDGSHDLRWPVLDEESHDLRTPELDEVSSNQKLSVYHLFKWAGNTDNYFDKTASNVHYSNAIPVKETKTTTAKTSYASFITPTTKPILPPIFPSSFSTKYNWLNFKETATTEATPTASIEPSFISTTPNPSLFIRPVSSRPLYETFPTIPESKTTKTYTKFSNFSQVCGRPRTTATARIVGGRKSRYLRWPWMISLRRLEGNTYKHKCGATLLNQYWAVTAAHCVDGKQPIDVVLRLGEHNFRRADEMHPHVERRIYVMVIHPEFDQITYENDLALLRFQEPVQLQANIVPVCLPHDVDDITGRIAVVTGWGRLSEEGDLPSSLHEVLLPILSNEECEQMYYEAGFKENIRDVFVCAGISNGGLDACEGDSGGPMVIRGKQGEWVLVGLISWGMGCAAPKQPGVYTRMSQFTDWVENIISH